MSNALQSTHRNDKDRTNATCWYCGKRVHLRRECLLRRRHDRDRIFKIYHHGRPGYRYHRKYANDNIHRDQSFRGVKNQRQYIRHRFRYHRNGQQNNTHQARSILAQLSSLRVSTTNTKSHTTWHNYGKHDFFTWDLNMFFLTEAFSKLLWTHVRYWNEFWTR